MTKQIAEAVKIIGHNLKGRNFTLKPVNRDINESTKSMTDTE